MPKSVYAAPSKVAPSKVANYIRAVFIDGKTRVTSYAKHVDPLSVEAPYVYRFELIHKLEARPDYEDIKQMIMQEDENDMLIRSSTARNKAFELLMNTLEQTNQAVLDSPDPKTLQAAAGLLAKLSPAFQAVGTDPDDDKKLKASKRKRAANLIRGDVVE